MTVSINTPKLSTAEHLRQIEIGDEWLKENKKAIQPPKKKKAVAKTPRDEMAQKIAKQCDVKRAKLVKAHKAELTKLLKDEFIPRKTVAKVLGVSASTLLRWAEKEQFPKTYFKKLKESERPTTCYKNSDLLEFLNSH